jgi:DNA-binding NtrC family response regulator
MEAQEKTTSRTEFVNGPAMPYPIVGKSRAVDMVVKHINRLAALRADVVVVGEAGVGKGAIAKDIHLIGQGDRKLPLVILNLSVMDDKDLEERLYGTDRTLHVTDRGLLKEANGGAVLFEEVEEASFRVQMKVLNFMADRDKFRYNEDGTEGVDVRCFVALKDTPQALLERRKILEDLYHKIVQFDRVTVSPLRERPEDIPLMVRHFSSDLCRELNMPELRIDINALDVLVRQNWKENIRELKAIVDKSVLFSAGGRFALPQELVDEKTEIMKMLDNIATDQGFVLDTSLDVIEKGIIERALQKFGFNQSRAAGFLGMTEQTLRYKLKRLGIAASRTR